MAYTKQYWLEDLRKQLSQVTNELAKTNDLRNLQAVKVETAASLSNKLKSNLRFLYEVKLGELETELVELEKQRSDLATMIMYLESHSEDELNRQIK